MQQHLPLVQDTSLLKSFLNMCCKAITYVLGLTLALFFSFLLYGGLMNWITITCNGHATSKWCASSVFQLGASE